MPVVFGTVYATTSSHCSALLQENIGIVVWCCTEPHNWFNCTWISYAASVVYLWLYLWYNQLLLRVLPAVPLISSSEFILAFSSREARRRIPRKESTFTQIHYDLSFYTKGDLHCIPRQTHSSQSGVVLWFSPPRKK